MKDTTEVMEPIGIDESKRLVELEQTIKEGEATFIKVGEALEEIRDRRLYRADHGTFEAYCKAKWNFTRMRASQLIAGAATVKTLPASCKQAVYNEGIAREVAKIRPSRRVKKIKAVAARAKKENRKPVASDFAPAKEPEPKPSKPEPAENGAAITPAQFQKQLDTMRDRIVGDAKHHEKFGVILNRAATEEMNFGRKKSASAYTR